MSLHQDQGEDEAIRLDVPALGPYARVSRLAITGLASRSGCTYDEVEDVRIAVGEVFGLLVQPAAPTGRIRFICRVRDDELEISAERVPPAPIPSVTDLSRQILDAVTDESTIDEAGGRITMRKHQARPS